MRILLEIAKRVWRLLPYWARLFAIRSWQKKFTVSVVALVTDPEGRVLVLDHYLRPRSTWGLPGGFVDPSEPPTDAICRELMEETGIEISGLELLEVRTIRKHIEILFRAEADAVAEVKSREIRAAGWFTLDELPDDMPKHQKERIRKELGS